MADGESYAVALDADTAVEFEFEEEQVMRGVNLQYSDMMDEAEEYFEGLKEKHARFSLHHAEVAVYKALMSNDIDDINVAIQLLSETEVLASQQEQKWRTHSRMKKVNAAMSKIGKKTSAFKSWALSKVTKKDKGEKGDKADKDREDKEEKRGSVSSPQALSGGEEEGPAPAQGSREEKVQIQRARRMRLRALQIQAECALMTALLQMVAAGESWTNMVKAGYNIKRTWSIFQHCQSKLEQIQTDWVTLGGSMTNAGPENFSEGFDAASQDASDEEEDAWASSLNKLKDEAQDPKHRRPTIEIPNEAPPVALPAPEPPVLLDSGFENVSLASPTPASNATPEPSSSSSLVLSTAQPPLDSKADDDFGDFAGGENPAAAAADVAKPPAAAADVAKAPDADVAKGDVAKPPAADVAAPKPAEGSTNPFDDGSDDGFGDFVSVDKSKKAPLPGSNTGKVYPDFSEEVGVAKMRASELAALGETKGVPEDPELSSLRVGVEFGVGLFNLMMSLIPPQFQKVLEVLGFPADREAGLKLLNDVAGTRSCRAPLASLMLLQYHMVIMGFLPRSTIHSGAALRLLNNLPANWKGSSIFKVLNSRFARYEGRLSEATELVKSSPTTPAGSLPNSCSARMRNVTLNELGWCLLLSGEFAKAADCFGALYKDTTWFKVHYACLQSACLWEAGATFHSQAAGLLRDIITLCGLKKNKPGATGPMEAYALRMATTFTSTQSAPLFPALELAAVYNGVQNMERAALDRHMARVEDALHTRCQKGFSEPTANSDKDVGSELVGSLLMSNDEGSEGASPRRSLSPSSSQRRSTATGSPKATFHHEWSEASKMLCRYLLGVLQKSRGLKDKASDSLRYVVVAGENIPGNMSPYSCYELGSMLLETPDTVADGFKLLEKSIAYPPHEFQGRLKFVVTERMRMYKESLPPTHYSFKSSSIKKTSLI